MPESRLPGRQDRIAAALGWLIFATFLGLFYNTVLLPTTPLDPIEPRTVLRGYHYTLGITVWVLVALRLLWWIRAPAPLAPAGLPESSFAFNRSLLLALLLTFFVTAPIGFIYAFADGQAVSYLGVLLPRLLPASFPVKTFTGYAHSTFGFYYLGVVLLWLGFGLYQHFRYRSGLLRLLPGQRV